RYRSAARRVIVSVLETSPVVSRSMLRFRLCAMVVMRESSFLGRGHVGLQRLAAVVVDCGVSGESEEDLVQGGPAQGDVVDLDAGGLDRTERRHQPVARGVDADGDSAGGLVDLRSSLAQSAERFGDRGEL